MAGGGWISRPPRACPLFHRGRLQSATVIDRRYMGSTVARGAAAGVLATELRGLGRSQMEFGNEEERPRSHERGYDNPSHGGRRLPLNWRR